MTEGNREVTAVPEVKMARVVEGNLMTFLDALPLKLDVLEARTVDFVTWASLDADSEEHCHE